MVSTSRPRFRLAPRTALIGIFVLALAGILAATVLGRQRAAGADPSDAQLVALGSQVYAASCASCHGANLEGQPNWTEPLPSGAMPAPPHDVSGHTWHHSDALLFAIVKQGGAAATPTDRPNAMPGFAGQLSDREIWAVLAYIKSTWPPEVRAAQQRAR